MFRILKVLSAGLLFAFSVHSFGDTCPSKWEGDSFYSFTEVFIGSHGVTCIYRCGVYGCDNKYSKIPGEYVPTEGRWYARNDGIACNFGSPICSFAAKP
jgi:hypothetical protein